MKRFLIAVAFLAFVLCACNVWAAPFLVCDLQTGVTSYDVEITLGNGAPAVQTGIPAQADGSLRLDLFTLTQPGNYTFRARAYAGDWGYSEWSLPFSATKPGSPGNVKIVRE
ncbi:MAG: hypothetical protein ABIJ57_13390 [Pseudomonadota bacterium]